MKQFISFIAVLMCFANIDAQQTYVSPVMKNEVGFQLGSTTGIGLSYRHWFGKVGLQLTGIPIKTENTKIYSIGLTALYTFYNARYIRVFGYLGNHYFYDMEKGNDQIWKGITLGDQNVNDNYDYYGEDSYYSKESYSLGFGPGFAFGNKLRFNVMIGYGFYDVLNSFAMYPCGEIGVYYRF